MKVHRGEPEGRGRRVAIVVARFNQVVTEKLLEGATSALRRYGVADEDVEVAWTPGAFEIPLVAKRVAATDGFDAVICLGAVVRGETAHFDLVAAECAAGVRRVALETEVPCILGVLATDTMEQALARAGGEHGNKGWEAATAALEMAGLLGLLPKREG
jgi:6,7-dimethyl-8-ribityllumazine synthase